MRTITVTSDGTSASRGSLRTRLGPIPDSWDAAPLRKGAVIGAGEAPVYVRDGKGDVPVIGSNGPIGWTSRPNATSGIAVGRVGASGSIHPIREPVWLSDNVLHVDGTGNIGDPGFLVHVLRQARLPQLATKTAQPLLTQTELGAVTLPVPAMTEQFAIRELLDAIDDAIGKTEEVIQSAERLRLALLHELLNRGVPGWHSEWKEVPGHGVIPACWERVRLGDVADVVAGFALGPERRPARNPTPYLTVANVQAGRVVVDELR
jgi:type I restriction enzyme S subunit